MKYLRDETGSNKPSITRRYILGVPVDFGYTMSSFISDMEKTLLNTYGNYISTTNPEFIMLCQINPEFLNIIKGAKYSVPDGTGVILANEYVRGVDRFKDLPVYIRAVSNLVYGVALGIVTALGKSLDERITGVSLLDNVCELSAQKGYTIFFLGGWPLDIHGKMMDTDMDIASIAADHFRDKYPGVNIIGASSGFSCAPKDDSVVLSYIQDCMKEHNLKDIDFLFLCYPQFKQEKWIVRNSRHIPAKVSVGVGRSFNYYSNDMKQPPKFVKKIHFEWLYTLLKQPWRYKRILQAFPLFPLRLYLESLRNS